MVLYRSSSLTCCHSFTSRPIRFWFAQYLPRLRLNRRYLCCFHHAFKSLGIFTSQNAWHSYHTNAWPWGIIKVVNHSKSCLAFICPWHRMLLSISKQRADESGDGGSSFELRDGLDGPEKTQQNGERYSCCPMSYSAAISTFRTDQFLKRRAAMVLVPLVVVSRSALYDPDCDPRHLLQPLQNYFLCSHGFDSEAKAEAKFNINSISTRRELILCAAQRNITCQRTMQTHMVWSFDLHYPRS